MDARARLAFVVLSIVSCNGFFGEAELLKPKGPPVAIKDPDYIILRAVKSETDSGGVSAAVHGRTVYYDPEERILDLSHLDPRTATIEQRSHDVYVVFIGTTPEGNSRLTAWTSTNLEKQLGIFVGGRLVAAPIVKSPISGLIVLDGDFTKSDAEDIVARLRRGGAAA